ncbi:MAG: 2-amino-4-hydroxy-6-hydroxymethyldihydropteridine diphosphokinase, partial [Pseudomonadota bacterium]
RTRTVRWESRVCDIDLLAYGDSVVPNHATIAEWMAMSDSAAHQAWPEELLLPHPRLHQRGFVLVPLMDVAPDWHHPVTDQTVAEMVAALPDEAIADIKAKDVYSTA